MNGVDFEGYTGINLNNITLSNDLMLLLVLLMLSSFAVIFRLNMPLFGKMINNINAVKHRQSIFETTEKDNFFLNTFMTFQTLMLCSIIIFYTVAEYKSFKIPDYTATLSIVGILLIILFIFFLFKKALYTIFSNVFANKEATKMLFTNHQALLSIWGIFLYFPVLWIILIEKNFFVATIALIISYLAFRAILIYRFIYIFFNKNTGLLFLSLYLCAQEIVPLVFLYEGLVYMNNIIENNIWQ
jgi:hypothetical protein